MSRSYFRTYTAGADPAAMLDPERQVTEPWGEAEHGACDKCGSDGAVEYECSSCVVTGARADCPSCRGRVRFRNVCPACLGDGTIDRTQRRGVAVFPTREGLYRYLALKEEDAELEGKVVVELQGPLSEERDLDADQGALLVLPERVVSVAPLDPQLVEATGV